MRWPLLVFLLVSTFGFSQELGALREAYPKASADQSITKALHEKLAPITKTDAATLSAYKGAVLTLKAKFAKGLKSKKTFFKEGAELLEYAISVAPKNIEIRCLRLGVQENAPKIVGYRKNIAEDKQLIIDNYASTTDQGIRNFVKGYVIRSAVFTDAEKQLF